MSNRYLVDNEGRPLSLPSRVLPDPRIGHYAVPTPHAFKRFFFHWLNIRILKLVLDPYLRSPQQRLLVHRRNGTYKYLNILNV